MATDRATIRIDDNKSSDYDRLQRDYARLFAAAENMATGLCCDNLCELRGVLAELKREEMGE